MKLKEFYSVEVGLKYFCVDPPLYFISYFVLLKFMNDALL